VYHILTKRRVIKSILSNSTGHGTQGYDHYIRLFLFSGLDILITLPFNIWYFVTWFSIIPTPGLKVNPHDWSHIPTVTRAQWGSSTLLTMFLELPRWIEVVYGFIFFIFFGVGAQAKRDYASAWKYMTKTIWQRKSPRQPSAGL
jgi:Pheromone A receptor